MKTLARCFDVAFAGMGTALFSPFFLGVSAAILLEDGAPVFFHQRRLGLGRRLFEVLKFRTMREGKVTRVGAWLRRTGLDETAQFFNVLRGEMSMVGPRPLTPEDVARLGWDAPAHARRWDVEPGITGIAQVLAGRSEKFSRRLEALYISRKSALLDFKLIAVSFAMNLFGKKRVRELIARLRSRKRCCHGTVDA